MKKPPVLNRASTPENQSLSDEAYRQIRDEILRGHFALGDILSRRRLAERLKMSFVPISEALQRLEADGLVESQPRAGTRVRVPTSQDVLDNYIIREALETQAARMCCERISPAEQVQLLKIAKHLDNLYRASASEMEDSAFLFSVHTYHMQFHLQIAKFSRSTRLVHAIEREQVLVFNWLYDTAAHRNVLPVNFHGKLAKAICSKDVRLADSEMREHVRFGCDDVVKRLNIRGSEVKGWRLKRSS